MRKPVGVYANILNLRCVGLEELEVGQKYWMATCNPDRFANKEWYSFNSLGGIDFYASVYVRSGQAGGVLFYDEENEFELQQLNRPARKRFKTSEYKTEVWLLKIDTIKEIFNGI